MKRCHKCQVEKTLDEFPVNKSKKDGRSETCVLCKRDYNKAHYQNNKQYYIDKAQKIKNSTRQFYNEYKTQLKCSKCQQNHPATLHFHHNDPSLKEINVSQAICRWSIEKIKKEIEKCDVLCANCHLIHHWNEKHKPAECDGSTAVFETARIGS